MSEQTYTPENNSGLEGFVPVRRGINTWGQQSPGAQLHEARVTEALQFITDVLNARTPTWALKESIAPTHPDALGIVRNNYPLLVREGMSVSDFPLLMGDVLDRMLMASFREGANPWRQYIYVNPRPLRDFRDVRRIKVDNGDGRWDQLGEHGGLKYTKLDETGYTYSPELYGKAIKLSFRQIMNDDLSAFDEIPRILGRGGRRTIHHYATSLLFDSNGPKASFVSAGNSNLITGNPALTVATLGDALQQLLEFTDAAGEPISVEGVNLVHGPGLHVTVQNILNQLSVDLTEAGGSAARTIRVNNWIVKGLNPVMDPYIPIVATTNGDTSWMLVASPRTNRPSAEIGFLAGFNEPVLYQKATNTMRVGGGPDQMAGDWSSMSQEYKGVVGMGGAVMEPKSLVGSNGSGS